MNLANTSMFQNKCLNKNATTKLFLIAKTSHKSIALHTLFPTAKRSHIKSATRNTRKSVTPLTFKSPSKKKSSTASGQNTDTIMIPPTVSLLNNTTTTNSAKTSLRTCKIVFESELQIKKTSHNIRNLMEKSSCEQKWALILQPDFVQSLSLLGHYSAI